MIEGVRGKRGRVETGQPRPGQGLTERAILAPQQAHATGEETEPEDGPEQDAPGRADPVVVPCDLHEQAQRHHEREAGAGGEDLGAEVRSEVAGGRPRGRDG